MMNTHTFPDISSPKTNQHLLLFFTFLSFFLTVQTVNASTLSDAAGSLNAGEWVEIETLNDESVIETDDGRYDLFDNYSSQMAYDPRTDAVYYVGCSHHNSSTCGFDCKFVKYDIATNTWTDETANAWAGFPACTDGSNSIAHGYDHSTVDHVRGDYYYRGSTNKIVRKFDISQGQWTTLTESPVTRGPIASGFGYFSSADKLVYVNSQHDEIGFYDLTSGQWDEVLEVGVPLGGYHDQACDLPVHGLFVVGGGNESNVLYTIDTAKNIIDIGNPGGALLNIGSDDEQGSIYLQDPASGDLILFSDNGNTYSWNPTVGWANTGIAPKMGTGGPRSVAGHAAVSLSSHGVIMAVRRDGYDVEVWLYKHAESSSDTEVPSAVTGVEAEPASTGNINLSWAPATDNVGVAGYRIERCQGADCTNFAAIAAAIATTYSDTGLAASTTYGYRIRAMDAATNLGPYSAIVSAETLPGTQPSPTGSFTMPSIQDEAATYDLWGWDYSSAIRPETVTDPYNGTYHVSNPDIHGSTEADDLWTYLQMEMRGGNAVYAARADAWLRFFKEDYRSCEGGSYENLCYDLDAYGGCHLYGWGLIAEYEYHNDMDALNEAIALGGILENLYDQDQTSFNCLPSNACLHYGQRAVGRHLILVSRLYEVTGDQRFADLRDKIIGLVLNSTQWNETYGMYFGGEWQTDYMLWDGAYAAGYRVYSSFEIGVMAEGLWQAYRTTGHADVKNRIIAMADYIRQYGMDSQDQYAGYRAGIDPDGNAFHQGTGDPNYTTALVNLLVMGYKLSGNNLLLEKATYFFNRGTKGVYGSTTERLAGDDEVHHFVDTMFDSSSSYIYLDRNKTELFYTYLIFENGGKPDVAGGAGINVLPRLGLAVSEAGTTDTFAVVLTSEPGDTVTLTISSSDTGEGTVFPEAITFTAADWNAAQTITVTGVDDALVDGDQSFNIIISAAQSSDSNYHGLDPDDVLVTNSDDDTEGNQSSNDAESPGSSDSGSCFMFHLMVD